MLCLFISEARFLSSFVSWETYNYNVQVLRRPATMGQVFTLVTKE